MALGFTEWLSAVFGVTDFSQAVFRLRSDNEFLTRNWDDSACKEFILYMYNACTC